MSRAQYIPMDRYIGFSYSKPHSRLETAIGVISGSLSVFFGKGVSVRYTNSGWSVETTRLDWAERIPSWFKTAVREFRFYSQTGAVEFDASAICVFRRLEHLSLGAHVSVLNAHAIERCSALRRLVVETPLNAKLNLGAVTSLEELACHGNTDLASLAGSRSLRAISVNSMSCDLPDLPMLSRLEISEANCIDLNFTPRIPTVEILALTNCQKLKSLEGIEHLANLTHVSVEGCRDLSDISSLSEMKSIRYLEVRNCPKILSFECLPAGIRDLFLFQISKNGLGSAKAAIERTRPQNYTLT